MWDSTSEITAQVVTDKRFFVKFDKNLFVTKKPYEYTKDQDFMIANGNETEFLQRKLLRAEETLIKGKLIYKISRNLPLSGTEKHFLNIWYQALCDTGEGALISQAYTDKSIGSLTESDFKVLRDLTGSPNLDKKAKNFALIDLVHELSLWVNGSIISNFERSWLMRGHGQEWGINTDLVYKNTGMNNSSLAVVDLMEEIKWEKANMFQEDEIKYILDLFGIYRGKF